MREGWQDSWDFWTNKRDVLGDAGFLGSFVVEKLQERRSAGQPLP